MVATPQVAIAQMQVRMVVTPHVSISRTQQAMMMVVTHHVSISQTQQAMLRHEMRADDSRKYECRSSL